MRPTMCRIVIYCQGRNEQAFNGSREHPAIVNAVFGAQEDPFPAINLTVFPDGAAPFSRSSVPHVGRTGGEGMAGWRWPELG